MEVKVLFVFAHDWIGKIIDAAEGKGENPSHTGIFLLDSLLEATLKGFVKSPVDEYRDCKTVVATVDIPKIEDAELEAKRLLYTPYGYIDCINGGIHDITGVQVPGDGEVTVNCSEAVTRILRAGGLDVLPGVYADCVTPADLYRALV